MRAKAGLTFLLLLACAVPFAVAQEPPAKDEVRWCSNIPISEVWREAQFSAVFVFEVDATGKPRNIKGIRVPLIHDNGPFISCISGWSIPSVSGKVTSVFRWKWRCLDIVISENGNHRTYPCQPLKPGG